MRSACDEADIRAGPRELHAEIPSDRAGAVDADFHRCLSGLRAGARALDIQGPLEAYSKVNAATSGGGLCRAVSCLVEGGRDVTHADNAGEREIVDHRQMPDVV